jgi:hypothetical protein
MSNGSMMIWMILEFTLDGKEAGTNRIKATPVRRPCLSVERDTAMEGLPCNLAIERPSESHSKPFVFRHWHADAHLPKLSATEEVDDTLPDVVEHGRRRETRREEVEKASSVTCL